MVVLPAYLRLLIFLLAILIPVCASSSRAGRRMYSAYKLNKHGDNIQPWLSILKSKDITLPTKVCLVKAMVFPVVMYRCESWTIKKAEHRRTDAFELWCWRRLLGAPWTARRFNQFIRKETSHEYSLEGLMLKLKLQYFGHLMQRTDSLEKTLMLGKIEGRRKRGQQRMRWLGGITNSTDMSLNKLSQMWLSDWTDAIIKLNF